MWVILAFLSACLLGFYDVFKKKSLASNAVLPVLMINTLVCAAFFVPFIVASSVGWCDVIPSAGVHAHVLVLFKAIIVLSSWVCGYFAMKHLPLTIVGPINATRPVMTLVGALLIYGEQLNSWQWAGVLLALFSFMMLSRSGKREGIRFSHNRWILLLVFAALTGAASGLYDKYLMAPITNGGAGLDRYFVQGWYNLYQAIMMTGVMLFIWYPTRKRSTPFKWRWSILLISVFLTAADMAYFYALSCPGAMISVVSMVRRGSVIVSFLFGAMMFHEKNLRAKAVDLFFVLLGMLCLFIGSGH
ncbi:MAG: DMT family transporter [Prevotella sp.]|nr:DMT family transporter [Prevotella sp.]MDY5665979.1 DMT family transporter [Alloprevotella sp.]